MANIYLNNKNEGPIIYLNSFNEAAALTSATANPNVLYAWPLTDKTGYGYSVWVSEKNTVEHFPNGGYVFNPETKTTGLLPQLPSGAGSENMYFTNKGWKSLYEPVNVTFTQGSVTDASLTATKVITGVYWLSFFFSYSFTTQKRITLMSNVKIDGHTLTGVGGPITMQNFTGEESISGGEAWAINGILYGACYPYTNPSKRYYYSSMLFFASGDGD